MKTLEEEKAEYARRIEIRETFERTKDTVDEIEIEALERDSEVVDHLESSNPSWNYDEYDYRIKPEPLEFWVNVYDDGTGEHCCFSEKSDAEDNETASYNISKTIKVREVIE